MPRLTVAHEHNRLGLVEYFSVMFPDRSVTGMRRLVGAGKVTVNGEAGQRVRTLRTGDEVVFPDLDDHVPRYVSKGAAPRVLARHGGVLALDKPAGLSVLPERQGRGGGDCVLTRVLPLLQPGERVHPVHRLDKDTSGVLLVATTRRAARELSRSFQNKEVQKTYRAVVRGVMLEDEGTIDMPLSRARRQSQQVRVDVRGGKAAVTRFHVVERFRGFTEMLLYPETGRTHQIRAHLRGIGFPLAVDPLYGSPHGVMLSEFKRGYNAKPHVPEKPLIARLPLHAEALVFPLPDSDTVLSAESELPKDMRVLLKQLTRWGRLRRE